MDTKQDREGNDGPAVEIKSVCGTCRKLGKLLVQPVRIFGELWLNITCRDGHLRSVRYDA